MTKKTLNKILLSALIVLVFFTFFSSTIYGLTLPAVSTAPVERAFLRKTADLRGSLFYDDTIEITAQDGWTVCDVFAVPGKAVSADDPLFSLDSESYTLREKSLQLDLLRVENSLALIERKTPDAKQAEITAALDGQLIEPRQLTSGQALRKGDILGRLVDDSKFVVRLYFSIAYKDMIHTGQTARVSIPKMMTELTGTVSKLFLDEHVTADSIAVFGVEIAVENPGTLMEGLVATAEIQTTNEPAMPTEPGLLKFFSEQELAAPLDGVVVYHDMREYARYRGGDVLLRIREENAVADDDYTAVQATRSELLLQKDLLNLQLDQLRGQFPADGIVRASRDGVVDFVDVKAGDSVPYGKKLIVLHSPKSRLFARFFMTFTEGEPYERDMSVSLSFAVLDEDGRLSREAVVTSVSSRKLSEDGWEFTAYVPNRPGQPLLHIDCDVRINSNGDIYDVVVPNSCVFRNALGAQVVYILHKRQGLFGEEYFVTENEIKILENNSSFVAVDSDLLYEGMDMIRYTSKPLRDGAVVRVTSP